VEYVLASAAGVIIVATAAAVERDDANAIVTMLLPPSCSNSFLARVLSLSLLSSQGWQMSATRAKQKRITIQGPNISTANFKTQNDTTTTFSCLKQNYNLLLNSPDVFTL
jgi:hypothetical protein